MFQPFKTVSNTVQMAKQNFRMDAVNVQTALETFQTGDASHSNGTEKISNGSCQAFERQTKNFERMMPAVGTANE